MCTVLHRERCATHHAYVLQVRLLVRMNGIGLKVPLFQSMRTKGEREGGVSK